jgi:peroxiredoxin
VAVVAFNDAFVMSAWGKANGVKNDDIYFLSDPDSKFSKSIGWNLGERSARYAMIIDNGKVVYAEKEPARDVTVHTYLPSSAGNIADGCRFPAQQLSSPSCSSSNNFDGIFGFGVSGR